MSKPSVLIFGVAMTAIIGGLTYLALPPHEAVAPIPASVAATQEKRASTIANTWQWNNFSNAGPAEKVNTPRATSAVSKDVVKIYKILQSIKLDENGLVVPDETLKEALEEGFDKLGDLSAKEMSDLQNLIRAGLPGPAGEGAAQILGNYYQFRFAEAEFNRRLESQMLASEAVLSRPTENQSFAVNRHKELTQLRRTFLGDEIAEKLFAVEDTQARHMFAAMAIEQNASLTAEEKRAKQDALQDRLNDRQLALGQLQPEEATAEKVRRLRERGATSAEIYSTRKSMLGEERASELAAIDREEAQWQSGFNGFWQARRYVMQAGLDEAERERQIEQLFQQYFSPEERERARLTSSEWQARDAKQAMN